MDNVSPGAFVWHHRRQKPPRHTSGNRPATVRPKRCCVSNIPTSSTPMAAANGGVLYGASLQGVVLDQAIIYRGVFGSGQFQSIYQPGAAHWAMLPSTLEWQVVAMAMALLGATSLLMAVVAGSMLWLTIVLR